MPRANSILPRSITDAIINLPATIDGGTETQVFQIFDRVPDGCGLWPVTGNEHAPHLREGEWVLVDFNAREIELGEVYLTLGYTGPRLGQVNLITKGKVHCGFKERRHFMLVPLNRPALDETGKPLPGQPLYGADGPYCEFHLRAVILGRVIGLIEPKAAADAMYAAAKAKMGGVQ